MATTHPPHPTPCCRLFLALLLVALLAALLPPLATLAASTCTVTSVADSGPDTLRQCLADVDAGGTITFALPSPSTIALTSSQLTINKSVTITGPGAANLILHGNDARRIFYITAGTVAISGLTIAHGKDSNGTGGGLSLFAGNLTLTSVTFSDSSGVGLFTWVGTTATVIDSTFTGNTSPEADGGGVFIQGTATLTNCTISGNTAAYGGGGMTVLGSATITNSTISGNTTPAGGGGGLELYKTGFSGDAGGVTLINSTVSGNTAELGGGIRVHANTSAITSMTLINSTVSGNTAHGDGGGIAVDGPATLLVQFTTVTNNTADSDNNGSGGGGGIYRDAFKNPVVQALGSIVAGNRKGPSTASDCGDGLTTQGGNVWGDATACPSGGAGDQNLATLGLPIGQVLAPLANNGGPTLTHALVAGSPAIDRVPTANCSPATGVDQRGTARPQGAACDSGAFEGVGLAPPGCVSGFADVPSNHPACPAIAALTAQHIINGYATNPPTFGPDQGVQRAQVAAFIVRALQWQNEATGPKSFTDFGPLVAELQTASLILANKCDMTGLCAARGYDPATCTAHGLTPPCFGPNDGVSYAQVISFVARAFQFDAAHTWQPQPNGALPYTGIPTVHEPDARTYHHYAGTFPLAPTTAVGWNQPAPRAWIALVLYQAIQATP